jgi:hypothetical protein
MYRKKEGHPMKNLFAQVYSTKISLNEKDEMKQNERNALKNEIVSALSEFLSENDFQVSLVNEGIACEISHEVLGSIPFVIGITMKPLSYDVVAENDAYLEKQVERIAKEKEKAEKAKKAKATK